MTESPHEPQTSLEEGSAPPEEEAKIKLTPALIAFGVLAILLGLGAGLIMSSATFFK